MYGRRLRRGLAFSWAMMWESDKRMSHCWPHMRMPSRPPCTGSLKRAFLACCLHSLWLKASLYVVMLMPLQSHFSKAPASLAAATSCVMEIRLRMLLIPDLNDFCRVILLEHASVPAYLDLVPAIHKLLADLPHDEDM